jgi:polynucleotide 5'-hydroxyl-kinase GRC3/NOL9
MRATENDEAEEALKLSASQRRASFRPLGPCPLPPTLRSASQLRLMQTMSYFHLTSPGAPCLGWDNVPLAFRKPLELHYSGPQQSIHGIVIQGEVQDPSCLEDAINGCVLGVVVMEDVSALSCCSSHGVGAEAAPWSEARRLECEEEGSLSARLVGASCGVDSEKAHVWRSAQGLPCISSRHGVSTPIDPTKSFSIGQVLVRGISVQRQTLEVLTPISLAEFGYYGEEYAGVVLVRGSLDTPGWVYSENLILEGTIREADRIQVPEEGLPSGITARGPEEDRSEDTLQASLSETGMLQSQWPWLSMAMPKGMERGKVWKVRRNLAATRDSTPRGKG